MKFSRILFLLAVVSNCLLVKAQDSLSTGHGAERIVCLGNNVYRVVRTSRVTTLYNQADSLRLTDGNYCPGYERIPVKKFTGLGRICEIVYDVLWQKTRHVDFENMKGLRTVIHIYLYITKSGELKEVTIAYNNEIEDFVTLEDMDRISILIKSSEVHAKFSTDPLFDVVSWMDFHLILKADFFQKVQEELKKPGVTWESIARKYVWFI